MRKTMVLLFVFLFLFVFSACSSGNTKSPSGTGPVPSCSPNDDFVKPENYASVILVSINPRLRLYLDEQGKVLAAEPVNEDAVKVIKELHLEGKEFQAVIKEVVKSANENGFIKDEPTVQFEVQEVKSDTVDTVALLQEASNTTEDLATEMEIEITVKVEDTTHTHTYSESNCTTPATCSCGATKGDALGHNYVNGICSRCLSPDPDVTYTSVKTMNGKWEFLYVGNDKLNRARLTLCEDPVIFGVGTGSNIHVIYPDEPPEILELIKQDPSSVEFGGEYYWMANGSGAIPMAAMTENGLTVTITDPAGNTLVLTRTGENTLKVTSSSDTFSEAEGKIPEGTILNFQAS